LLGHLLEVCQGSRVRTVIDWSKVPILPMARTLATQRIFPGAARRNWDSYREQVSVTASSPNLQEWETLLLADPQTAGDC
jgi:selenide,water dikinase